MQHCANEKKVNMERLSELKDFIRILKILSLSKMNAIKKNNGINRTFSVYCRIIYKTENDET